MKAQICAMTPIRACADMTCTPFMRVFVYYEQVTKNLRVRAHVCASVLIYIPTSDAHVQPRNIHIVANFNLLRKRSLSLPIQSKRNTSTCVGTEWLTYRTPCSYDRPRVGTCLSQGFLTRGRRGADRERTYHVRQRSDRRGTLQPRHGAVIVPPTLLDVAAPTRRLRSGTGAAAATRLAESRRVAEPRLATRRLGDSGHIRAVTRAQGCVPQGHSQPHRSYVCVFIITSKLLEFDSIVSRCQHFAV